MGHKTFKEIIAEGVKVSDVKVNTFIQRLTEHGEVQIKTAAGAVYTMHLGDKGNLEDGVISFTTRDGERNNIFTDQIEAINTHKGYQES